MYIKKRKSLIQLEIIFATVFSVYSDAWTNKDVGNTLYSVILREV